MQQFCYELQVASEFSGADVYTFNTNFYSRTTYDFGINDVFISETTYTLPIKARNCYLRNAKTNANIYVTAPTEKYRFTPRERTWPNSERLETIVVLECYENKCKIAALYAMNSEDDRYTIDSTYSNVYNRVPQRFPITFSMEKGTNYKFKFYSFVQKILLMMEFHYYRRSNCIHSAIWIREKKIKKKCFRLN